MPANRLIADSRMFSRDRQTDIARVQRLFNVIHVLKYEYDENIKQKSGHEYEYTHAISMNAYKYKKT